MTITHNSLWSRLGGVLLGVSAFGLAACGEEVPTPMAADNLQRLEADMTFYDMETYLAQDGIRSGTLRADSAYQFEDSAKTYLWNMDMTLYYEEEEAAEGVAEVAVAGELRQLGSGPDRSGLRRVGEPHRAARGPGQRGRRGRRRGDPHREP